MANFLNNVKRSSPSWMVNMTAGLALLTPILPSLINTLPGNVSQLTRDWLTWMLSVLTAVSGVITAFSRTNKVMDGPGGTDPVKPKPPTP
jgi:predicted benzoate:H+ symporter BenE